MATARPNTDVWHTDLTFKQNPPFASILYAKAIPACGGDTLWCSMYAAYEALPDGMKADLRDLSAVHATGSYWNQFFAQGGLKRLKEGMAAMGAAVHPVVAHHPMDTGKPFLYVNRHFTTHMLGMSSGDSQRLLTALFDHINQPDFQVRFRWHRGTVASGITVSPSTTPSPTTCPSIAVCIVSRWSTIDGAPGSDEAWPRHSSA